MFKDKNFGLPKNLVESARSVMQNQYGKKKPPVKKSATTSSNKLSENHVVKFTFYLKENFHINELTEEEIAWIYENEYVQWLEEQSFFEPIIQAGKDAGSVISKGITRLKRGASDIASRAYDAAYDALPDVTDAAKRETQRNREDAESGAQMRDAALNKAVPSAKDAFAKDYDYKPSTPSTPRPSASARREPQESDYQAAKKAVPYDSSDPGATARERLEFMYRRRGNKAAGNALKGPPKEPFSKTAYEPGGPFDRD